MVLALAVLILAVALASLVRSAEAAVFSVPESRLRALVDTRTAGARELLTLRERPDRLLLLLRFLAVGAEVAVVAAAAHIGFLLGGGWGLVAASAGTLFLLLIGGTSIPTRVLLGQPLSAALAAAPPLGVLTRLLRPLLALLESLPPALPKYGSLPIETISETQIRQIAALGHHEEIEEHERQLIERAIRLDERQAWDIMTPRVDVFAWRDDLRLSDIARELGTVPYSRVPIYGTSIDDVTGVLHVRDAYQALVSGQRDVLLRALARQPLIVPGSVSLTTLLRDFQTRRIHLAIVVDDYGGTDGLVTLEDVIEELVGEIVDETDVAEEAILRVSRNEIEAAGDVDLRELNHYFNTAFPLLEHRSLNGFLLEELGRVPQSGEQMERDGVRIEVMEATETQVLRARLTRAHVAMGGAADAEGEPDVAPTATEQAPHGAG